MFHADPIGFLLMTWRGGQWERRWFYEHVSVEMEVF
jgi:hypothetical protein